MLHKNLAGQPCNCTFTKHLEWSKTAKETPNQEHRRWESLNIEHPNTAKVVHNLSNGWTIQQLGTRNDVQRTGKFMRNCWAGRFALTPKRFDNDSGYYTMNDEAGKPRVAFNVHPYGHQQGGLFHSDLGEPMQGPMLRLKTPLGMRNNRLTPMHADLFREWASARKLPLAVEWGGHPAPFEHPSIQTAYFSGKGHVFDGLRATLGEGVPAGRQEPFLPEPELEDTDMLGNRFDAKVAQIIEIPENPEPDFEDPTERPFIYDRHTGIVHLGHPGDSHSRVYNALDPNLANSGMRPWRERMVAGAINHTTGELNEHGDELTDAEQRHVYDLLGRHLGVTPFKDEDDWEDKFGASTWDDEPELSEEEELAAHDIRDPYANFDHDEPVRHVNNPVPREHVEDEHSDSTQGREAWDFDQQDSPVIFDGRRFYMGSPNSYHWDMVRHEPELAQHFDMDQYMMKNPLNATKPEDRSGLAYGRFNPASESATWYHRGRFHPDKFDALAQQVWPGHWDESEEMGYGNKEDRWQNLFAAVGPQHHLVWEPGWPGKGFYHKGELTTWGVSGNSQLSSWPHHAHMFQQKYPNEDIAEAMRGGTLMFLLDPEGHINEAHPYKGDWDATLAQIHQIEPRFKQAQGETPWENQFS